VRSPERRTSIREELKELARGVSLFKQNESGTTGVDFTLSPTEKQMCGLLNNYTSKRLNYYSALNSHSGYAMGLYADA
jgi:hypothetical protein